MFDLHKIYTDLASWLAVTIAGGIVGMIGWVVSLRRKVATNEAVIKQNAIAQTAQIELIMAELRTREKQREEDRDRMERVEGDIRDSRRDIQEIKNALIGKSG